MKFFNLSGIETKLCWLKQKEFVGKIGRNLVTLRSEPGAVLRKDSPQCQDRAGPPRLLFLVLLISRSY